jgi:hypothetical protein
VSHKLLDANYATQYTHMYNDILSVLWHDRSTDRSIDQYKIEKIDRSTKELIVTSLLETLNSSEQMSVSGSHDSTIKFWNFSSHQLLKGTINTNIQINTLIVIGEYLILKILFLKQN